MKKIVAILFILLFIFGTVTVYASNTNQNVLTSETATTNLVEMKDKALKALEDYQVAYGNNTYGLVAYILNIVRIYSIPFGFVGIVFAAIYRYVIGIRKLDVQDKGFGVLVAIITVMVICQVLPLIFAIVDVVDFPSTNFINSSLPPFSRITFASGKVSTV